MRKLRRFLFFFSLCAFACAADAFVSAVPARAQSAEQYARVKNDDTVFFLLPGQELFLLAKGYYVLIKGETETYYRVEYQAHPGYVLKSDIEPESEGHELLYPNLEISVRFTTVLKTGAAIDSPDVPANIITTGSTLLYFGSKKAPGGAAWHYVRFENYFGYVDGAAINSFSVPVHPKPFPPPPQPPVSQPPVDNPPQTDFLKIVLILGVSIPALIIIVLLFRPNKKTQPAPRIPSFMEEFDDLDEL